MTQSKTHVSLGGDRLGTGKKTQVELHQFGHSTHDLSHLWKSTIAPGTLVPFMKQLALPNDTFEISLDSQILTLPTLGPLFGSFKAQFDVFQVPMRLYNSHLHNNALGVGLDMSQIKIPQIRLYTPLRDGAPNSTTPDYSTSQINPSSLFRYLGIGGLGSLSNWSEVAYRDFNAIPYLAYWDIYKNYYANKQEKYGKYLWTDPQTNFNSITKMELYNSWEGAWIEYPTSPTKTWYEVATTIFSARFTFTSLTGTPNLSRVVLVTNKGNIPISEFNPKIYDTSGSVVSFTLTNNSYKDLKIQDYIEEGTENFHDAIPQIVTFPLSDIDKARENLLKDSSYSSYIINNTTGTTGMSNNSPYSKPAPRQAKDEGQYAYPQNYPQCGLALKTYMSDIYNNFLNSADITAIATKSSIDSSGGTITIDQINLSEKIYKLLNQISVTGGSYDDWLNAVYNIERQRGAESPIYLGGLSKEVVFQQITQTNANDTEDTISPTGTPVGQGKYSDKHKGGFIKVTVNEPSYIIGIVSLTPRLDYSQGNDWDMNLETYDDLHKPALDAIGFQPLVVDTFAWWSTEIGYTPYYKTYKTHGLQPSWLNYMTETNKVRGNFALQEQSFMTLQRQYLPTIDFHEVQDMTTYIDPQKFNNIFAQTDLTAQNFWIQISLDIKARRLMSARQIPNL